MNQIFEEKDNQIRLLKNIISLNEEQSKNQKNLIDSLKKQLKFEQNLNSTLTEEKSKLIKEKSEISENYQKLQKEFEIIKSNLEIQKTSLKSKDQEKPLELTNQFDILKKRAISFKLTDIKESEKLKDCNFDRAQTEFIPLDVSPKKSYYETPILTENSEKEANISFTTLENIKKYNCESSNSSQRDLKLEQRYDDLRSSVVALNYQSTLLNSPEIINNEIPMQNSNKNLLRRKSSIIDFAPITNFKKRNTIVFNKLNEIEEFMDERTPQGWVQNENINFGGDSLSVKTKKKLFEEFALLGIDKKDLLKIDKQNLEKGYLEPQVIYDFPPNNECSRKRILHEFAFPKGAPFKRIKINNSFHRLNEIAFSYNPNDHYKKSFIFTLRSEDYYDNNNTDPFLHALNPERILYCICFIKKDYFETTDEKHIYERKNRKFRKFWLTKKIFCFVTFFPFVKLFIEILEEILNKIKFKRLEEFTLNRSEEHEILKKIDLSMIEELLRTEIHQFLENILKTPLPKYGENFKISGIFREKINYELPSENLAEYERSKWGVTLTFSNLHLDDLLFIFVSILLEKKIVFFSKDIALLTATIHTFYSILRPFTWPHPIIFIMPEALITLLESPVPYIFGLNEEKGFLTKIGGIENYPKTIFYDLDENRIIFNDIKIKKIMKLHPNLDNLREKIKEKYKSFNTFSFGFVNQFQNSKNKEILKRKNKNLIYNPNCFEQEQCKQIFEIIKNSFYQTIIKHVPEKPIFEEDDPTMLNYNKITEIINKSNHNAFNEIFFKKFLKTQIFTFFLERFYNL